MKRLLLAFLLMLFPVVPGATQTIAHNSFFTNNMTTDLLATVKTFGGFLIDFKTPQFGYADPVTKVYTPYANFAAMYAANGGTAVTSEKWCFNKAGILTQFPANTPAQPCYSGSGLSQGLRWEHAATNSLLQSNTFTVAPWATTGGTWTANNRKAPTGTNIASTLAETATTGLHSFSQSFTKTTALITYTASCYVAAGNGNRRPWLQIDDGTGTPNGARAVFTTDFDGLPPDPVGLGTPYTNLRAWQDPAGVDMTVLDPDTGKNLPSTGFIRVGLTATANAATTLKFTAGLALDDGTISYAGDTDQSLAFFQCEAAWSSVSSNAAENAPSLPRFTTTTAVTSVIDQIYMNVPANLQVRPAYSWYVDVTQARADNGITNNFWNLQDAAAVQRIGIQQIGSTDNILAFVTGATSGNLQRSLTTPYNAPVGAVSVLKPGANYLQLGNQQQIASTNTMNLSNPMTKMQFGGIQASSILLNNGALAVGLLLADAVPTALLNGLLFNSSVPPYNPDVVLPPNYFTQAMISGIPGFGTADQWDIVKLASMPKVNNDPAYTLYPLTVAWNVNIALANLSTATDVKYAWLYWGNRCSEDPPVNCDPLMVNGNRPNGANVPVQFVNGLSTGTMFNSYAKANAATYAQLLYALGYPATAGGACPAGKANIAAFKGTSSGTTLTVSDMEINGFLWPGYVVKQAGTPIGKIVSQTSGDTGYNGAYVLDTSPAVSNVDLTADANMQFCGYNDAAASQGLTTVPYATITADPGTFFNASLTWNNRNFRVSNDKVPLANGLLKQPPDPLSAYGIICDCEMNDYRKASIQTAFLIQMQSITASKGLKYGGGSHQLLLGPGYRSGYCGVGISFPNCDMGNRGNLGIITHVLDNFVVCCSSSTIPGHTYATALADTMPLFGPSPRLKSMHWQYNTFTWPGLTTLKSAKAQRDFMAGLGLTNLGGLHLPGGWFAGGSALRCTNQEHQMIFFGTTTDPVDPLCEP